MSATDPIFVILPVPGPGAPDPWKNPGIVPPWLREKAVPAENVGGGEPRFRDCGFGRASAVGMQFSTVDQDRRRFPLDPGVAVRVFEGAARVGQEQVLRVEQGQPEVGCRGEVVHDR